MKITHDNACRLSILFNRSSDLRTEQDIRINEWLKQVIQWAKLSDAISAKDAARGRQLTPEEKLANLEAFLGRKLP